MTSTPKKTRRQIILDTVDDLVTNFIAYDRKEDEDLPLGDIEDAIEQGEITANEIASWFRTRIIEELGS